MLKFSSPDFVVASVAKNTAPSMIEELANRKVPILAETPTALDLEILIKLNRLTDAGAKIQAAEQYHLQPMHAACIAVASCVEKMYRYVKGGPDFYSLAEASQDQYIALMINKAIITGEKVVTENQPWVYNM